MNIIEMTNNYNRFRFGEDNFHELMQYKIRRILLISTFYDAFILEQDGHLAEQIRVDYREMKLTSSPRITTVPNGALALKKIKKHKFDLVITMLRVGNTSPFELSKRIKDIQPDLPVVLLLNNSTDLRLIHQRSEDLKHFDGTFLWRGHSMLFLAILKSMEDKRNALHDTRLGMVRIILIVEDNIYDYSRFLPLLYTEIMKQTQLNIQEEHHVASRTLRMRARPKILLAKNYEEAMEIFEEYQEFLLCVISDVTFPRNGVMTDKAGIQLIKKIRTIRNTLPACLHSTEVKHIEDSMKLGASFLHKTSKNALRGLKVFIESNLGFGDFIFRNQDGNEIGRASSMYEFESALKNVPLETLHFHGSRNHFSTWLIARGELYAAKSLEDVKTQDFDSLENNRKYLLQFFEELRTQKDKGRILDFEVASSRTNPAMSKIGGGSLGGKGRGLAFLNAFIASMGIENSFKGARVRVPKTVIIGTEEFDIFIELNNLDNLPDLRNDEEIRQAVLKSSFSYNVDRRLREVARVMTSPLAIRSSSLLEDSQSQPFAGIYETYMLPNNSESPEERYEEISRAVKLVYASCFSLRAKEYFELVEFGLEEEKMAVVIQEVAGSRKGDYFYPHFSGVACSHDFYPMPFMKSSEGIARIAVGLGCYIVGGGEGYRFCPSHPTKSMRASDEIPQGNQVEFYAIDMKQTHSNIDCSGRETATIMPIKTAEEHGALWQLASTYDPYSSRIEDGITGPGTRVLDFSGILKHESFPLSDILKSILDIGEKAMGVPVEIEFAVTLDKDKRRTNPMRSIIPTFYLLQIRPLLTHQAGVIISKAESNSPNLIVKSSKTIGNSDSLENIDIVYVDPDEFDRTNTEAIASEIDLINNLMKEAEKNYILIGPGRWGTRDRFLGIPVAWAHISRATTIVETPIQDFAVESSQGSHFFHNLLSLNVGYMTIDENSRHNQVNYDWLKKQKPSSMTSKESLKFVRHISPSLPLRVKIDGKSGKGIIAFEDTPIDTEGFKAVQTSYRYSDHVD